MEKRISRSVEVYCDAELGGNGIVQTEKQKILENSCQCKCI